MDMSGTFPNIDHIYIVHCDIFVEKKLYLEKVFQTNGINPKYYTFCVNTYKDSLTSDIINKYYSTDEVQRNEELRVIGEDKYLTKNINKGSLSCGINHLAIWETVTNSTYEKVLILEDDILFLNNSMNGLISLMKQFPQACDVLSLENGAGLTVERYLPSCEIKPDKLSYKIPDGRMRCTGAYVITKKACNQLVTLNKKRKYSLEIDMQMWLYGKLGILKTYWAAPHLFTQGSQVGAYESAIQ